MTPGAGEAPGATAPNAADATTGRSVLGGTFWSTAGRLVPQAYTLVVSIAAARFLTTGEFGRQSFIAFVELSVIMLLTGGLSVSLMRYIGETIGAERPGAVRGLIRWAWGVFGVTSVAGGGVLVVVAALGAEPEAAWALAGLAAALAILHCVPSALLIGAQLWRPATIAGLVNGSVSTVATVAVLALGWGITGMFAVEAATSFATLVWTSVLAKRAGTRLGASAEPAGPLRRRVTRFALVGSIGVVLNFVVWRRSEFFFLQHYSDDAEIGFYSIAFAVSVVMVRLPEALAEVSTTAVATLFGAGQLDRIRTGFGRGARLLLIMALPLTVAGFTLGPAAIQVVWGSAYADAGPMLIIMLTTFPVLPLFYLGRAALVGVGRQHVLVVASAFAAAVDLTLAWLLVPDYGGNGAAIANAGAQVAAGLPVAWYANRILGPIRWELGSLVRTAAASGAAGAVALAAVSQLDGALGLFLGLAGGAATFALLAVTLRIFPAQDAQWLVNSGGRVFHGWVGRFVLRCGQRQAP